MTETFKKNVYGIDLGTTYSAISFIDEFGKAQVIPNSDNERITPSVVFFENEVNIVVGTGAIVSAATDPDRVVKSVKRLIHDTGWSFDIGGKSYKPEAISALVLKRLAEDAAKTGEHNVKDVVITVPAYFGDLERQWTRTAGELAGLNVIEILDEPVAAAINYGLNEEAKGKNVIVYGLGGGTFDVTVVKIGGDIDKNEISIVCTDGHHELGGKDWDDRIVQFLASEFQSQTGSDENILEVPDTAYDLQTKAEQNKKLLPKKDSVAIAFQHEGQKIRADLTLEKFEELTVDLVERTIALTDSVLELAKKKGIAKINTFLLVGGSTRMKQIKAKLTDKYQPILGVVPVEFDVDEAAVLCLRCCSQNPFYGSQVQVVTLRPSRSV